MENIYETKYVVRDLREDLYVTSFYYRDCYYTNKIYKAKFFDNIEEALELAKCGDLEFIRIDTIRVFKDYWEN